MDRHHQKGLPPIDPLAVPLPHGTEVTTRVERLAGDRRVPQGVVGRVVAIRDDGFDVLVTGIGVLRYARDELMPRRPGQVRFAEQRAADWDALRPCVALARPVRRRCASAAPGPGGRDVNDVLDAQQRAVADRVLDEESASRRHLVVSLSGAHAYGFPSPDSDLDLKAIHVAPTEQLLGLSPPPANAPDRIELVDGIEIDYSPLPRLRNGSASRVGEGRIPLDEEAPVRAPDHAHRHARTSHGRG